MNDSHLVSAFYARTLAVQLNNHFMLSLSEVTNNQSCTHHFLSPILLVQFAQSVFDLLHTDVCISI